MDSYAHTQPVDGPPRQLEQEVETEQKTDKAIENERIRAPDVPASPTSSASSQKQDKDFEVSLKKSNVQQTKPDEEDLETALERLPEHDRAIIKKQLDIPPTKINYLSLYRYARKQDLAIIFVSSLASIIAGALLPLMTVIFGTLAGLFRDRAIDAISQADFVHKLGNYTLYFVYLMVTTFTFTYISTVGFLYVGETITDSIREQYLKTLLRQNIGIYDKLGPGAITFSLTGQMSLIQKGVSEKVGLTLTALATFFTAFIIGFIRNAQLTGVLISIVVALTVDMGVGSKFLVGYSKKAIEASVYGGAIAEEVISSIRDTTAFGTQERLAVFLDKYLLLARKWGYKKNFSEAGFLAGMFFVVNANYALSFWYGSVLIARGSASLSEVLTVLLSVLIGSFSLGNVAPNFGHLFGAVSAAGSIFAAIDRPSPLDPESEEGEKLEKVTGDIEFRNTRHIYPSRPDVTVLHDFSLTCPAGKTTALVGLSGSGKSTVIGLLERFYLPVGGEILLDGVPIENLNLKWLRQQISLVSQEPVLFAQTIFENVANGLIGTASEGVDAEKKRALVEDACKLANAHDFIQSLPDGYETNVGDKGHLMSGGQRQRIAIARAVISQPKILLLDEATSALDTTAEAQVQLALDRAAAGRTTITIAHRLSTIKNADKIVVMSAGRIVEAGSHKELLDKRGNYYDLVQAQTLAQSKSESDDEILSSDESVPADPDDLKVEEDLARMMTTKSDGRGSVKVTKNKDEEEKYSIFRLIRFIAAFNKPEKWLSIFGFFVALFCGLMNPTQAVLFAKSVTSMSVPPSQYGQMRKDLNLYGGLYFMVAILHSAGFGLQSSTFGITSERLIRRARLETFRRFLRQEIGWFDRDENAAGSLVAYLSTETQHLAGISGTTLGTIISAGTTVIGGFILAISVGWKLGLVVSSCLPIALYCGYLRFAMLNRFSDRAEHVYQDIGNYACEATGLIRTVASLTREEDILSNYHSQITAQRRASLIAILKASLFYAASQSLNFGIMALAFWYGGTLLGRKEYSTFQFFLCYSAVIFASQSAGAAFAFAPDISSARSAAKRMINLFQRQTKVDWEGGAPLPSVEGSIEFRDVQFSFPTRPNHRVLKGLSLSVKPGQYVALVGPSGCGKSTTVSLLERFYEPAAGQILVDGKDISTLNINEYRSHLALVSQDPVLYQGSIRDNIVLGSPTEDVSEDDIVKACQEANIYDFITSLPDGFNTIVGAKGSLLSGGQKQRIVIARALIRNPRILLLDEATSALDSESEKVVQKALDVAAKGRSTIAVAHRLSTIQKADMIYVFESGRIVESGTHQELMSRRGRYYELVNLQSLNG